jgi:hypothetical protein
MQRASVAPVLIQQRALIQSKLYSLCSSGTLNKTQEGLDHTAAAQPVHYPHHYMDAAAPEERRKCRFASHAKIYKAKVSVDAKNTEL